VTRVVANRERGAALLTVLMLVAVISVLAAISFERFGNGTRIVGQELALDQARAYAMAGESVAAVRITDLTTASQQQATDAQDRPITQPIEGGRIVATLRDGGNCFNLNSIVSGTPETGLFADPLGMAHFAALLRLSGERANDAQLLAAALADWIDSDTAPLAGGGEDTAYRGYRSGNTLMADISELRAVRGVSSALYQRLRPLICALPTTEAAAINVNTLRLDQAGLIAALIPGQTDVNLARQLILDRPAGGYASADAFWKTPALSGLSTPPDVLQQTSTRTRWFTLIMQIQIDGATLHETALIDGGLRPARLIRRRWGDAL
jgi:general secretion pathway protein K